MPAVQAIEIVGVRTDSNEKSNFSIPYRQITALIGTDRSSRKKLALDTIYNESKRRLAFDFEKFYEFDNISGLLPAIDLNQNLSKFADCPTLIGEFLSFNKSLRIIFSDLGKRYCRGCNSLLDIVKPFSDKKKNLIIAYSLQTEATKNKLLSKIISLVKNFYLEGQTRFLIGNKLLNTRLLENENSIDIYVKKIAEDQIEDNNIGFGVVLSFVEANEIEETIADSRILSMTMVLPLEDLDKQEVIIDLGKMQGRFIISPQGVCHNCLKLDAVKESSLQWREKKVEETEKFSFEELKEFLDVKDKNKEILSLEKKLDVLIDLGLGRCKLSQSIQSLSSGERVKIGIVYYYFQVLVDTLFIIHGLSATFATEDLSKVMDLIQKLVDQGNTVLLDEHNNQVERFVDNILKFDWHEEPQIEKYHKPVSMSVNSVLDRSFNNSLTAIVGSSGSGKTLLLKELLKKHPEAIMLSADLQKSKNYNSTLAEELGFSEPIAKIFSETMIAKRIGLFPKDFMLNRIGGRCELCRGLGRVEVDFDFLGCSQTICEKCLGKRFNAKVLRVLLYAKFSIADILEMRVEKSAGLFANNERLSNRVKLAEAVGLGNLSLGQLTGSVAKDVLARIELTRVLSSQKIKSKLLLLDQVFSGLDSEHVGRCLVILKSKNFHDLKVIVVTHDSFVINQADYVCEISELNSIPKIILW